MSAFPVVTLQLPLTHERVFNNATALMEAGLQYTYYYWAAGRRRWELTFDATDAELSTLKAFWVARRGGYESFTFTDPDTSSNHTVRFVGDSLQIRHIGPNQYSITMALEEDL